MPIDTLAAWLFTLALHACALLAVAWVVDRFWLRSRPEWGELVWRTALLGALLTASAQSALNMPMTARVALQSAATSTGLTAPATTRGVTMKHTVSTSPSAAGGAQATKSSESAPAVHVAPALQIGELQEAVTAVSTPTPAAASPSLWASLPAPDWKLLAVVAWLAGCAVALIRVFSSWLRLKRLLLEAEPLAEGALRSEGEALSALAQLPAPRLAVLDELASPLAAFGQRIVLPRWALELLDRDQLRAMLAHETAHLGRRDPFWKLVIAVACVPLWFVPLTALARRRLDELAELACDAWAAYQLGEGRALAECIAECAEHRHGAFVPALASAMAGRGSPLLQRIDHLLEGTAVNSSVPRLRGAAAALGLLALAAVALPGFVAQASPPPPPPVPAVPAAPPAPPAPPDEDSNLNFTGTIETSSGSQDLTQVHITRNGLSFAAKIKGKIAFTDTDDDIARLSDSARFSETKDGVQRRIEYTNHDGKIERRYFVGDREQPIDDTARAWIAQLLPTVIRETGVGADERIKRIRAKGGNGAVLDEIVHIESDYARSLYIKKLLAIAKLEPAEVTRVLQLIDGIGSDYERRNALAAVAKAAPLDVAQQKLVVGQAEKIGSDYERSELLIGMLPKMAPDASLRSAWLHAGEQIGSDYERRRTLQALLEKQPLDDATLGQVIDSANSIGSDYERRELLVAAVHRVGDAECVAETFGRAANGIGSDYERREAAIALIHAPKFGAAGSRAVLDVAANIGSDYECREVLVALATVMPADSGLIARYREIARRLSDTDRGAAERALDRVARS